MTNQEPVTLSYQPPQQAMSLKGRSGRCIAAGILLLFLACWAMLPVLRLVQFAMQYGVMSKSYFAHPLLRFLPYVVALSIVGIGAIRRQRWSRPVILAGCAAYGTKIALHLVRSVIDAFDMPSDGRLGAGSSYFLGMVLATAIVSGCAIGLLCILVVPSHVRLTLEYYDQSERWTDHVPIKIIALAIGFWMLGMDAALDVVAQLNAPDISINSAAMRMTILSLLVVAGSIASGWLILRLRRAGFQLGWVTVILYGLILPVLSIVIARGRDAQHSEYDFSSHLFTQVLRYNAESFAVVIILMLALAIVRRKTGNRLA